MTVNSYYDDDDGEDKEDNGSGGSKSDNGGYYSTQNTKNCLINQLARLLNRNRMPW